MVQNHFRKASPKVNKELTKSFRMTKLRIIGYSLSPLIYAIASNGLSWLSCDQLKKGIMKGINIGNNSQLCLELFADNTNVLIENKEKS